MQKQYVEKPVKVLAEQYATAADPPAVGVHTCGLSPLVESGPAHVHLPGGAVHFLTEGEWILARKADPATPTEVLSDADFADRFGSGGGPNEVFPT
jgi:hypothetical protein